MATLSVVYEGDLRTKATFSSSASVLFTDAPVEIDGKGEYFSPTDLLVSALASCMITFMGKAAQVRGFDIKGTRAEISKVMASNPRRIAEISIDFYFPHNDYPDKVKRILELASKECPVSNTLHPDTKKNVYFHYGEE